MSELAPDRCRRYRRRILEISQQVAAAHVAPAFSCVEIVDVLYHEVMREQDIFIMSKGHGCLAQYVVLEDRGVIPRSALDAYCRPPTGDVENDPPSLGAHPDYDPGIGIHASTGSLGHGLGIAAGQAYAERLKGSDARVYVLLSDGECQEGSTWEAAMVAADLRLNNLIALVDANNWGGMDNMTARHPGASVFSLSSKFRAFNWHGNAIDGHDPYLIKLNALHNPSPGTPSCIVCRTDKGHGVSFIEDGQPLWHYRSPTPEEYVRAMKELE
jgi:transketolase